MSINLSVGQLPTAVISSMIYDTVKLPDMNLDLDPEGDGLLAKIGTKTYTLTDHAIESLCGYLGVPVKFAMKLREDGKAYIIAYLQQQLSKAMEIPVIFVSNNEDEILSFTESRLLPFRGQDCFEIDRRIEEFASVSEYPYELFSKKLVDGNAIHYIFLNKETCDLPRDPDKQNWRWGFTLDYSLIGKKPARFGMEIMRVESASLTYLPDKVFGTTPKWEGDIESKFEEIYKFFSKEMPEPDWRQINRWVARVSSSPASVAELKAARKKLCSVLMASKDDTDTQDRIDTALQWKRVEKEYGLDDKEFKPSKPWYMKATTPLSLFEVQSAVVREGTAAPNNIPFDERQGLLIYGGKLLAKVPDISEVPPSIVWALAGA